MSSRSSAAWIRAERYSLVLWPPSISVVGHKPHAGGVDRPAARPDPVPVGLEGDAEITLEANPASTGPRKAADPGREAGVNRLSIGVQGFDPRRSLSSSGGRTEPGRRAIKQAAQPDSRT